MKKARRDSETAAKAASQVTRAKAVAQATRSKKLVMYTSKGNKLAPALLLSGRQRNRSGDVHALAGRVRLLEAMGASSVRARQPKSVKKPKPRNLAEGVMALTRAETRAMHIAERDPNRPTRKLSPRPCSM